MYLDLVTKITRLFKLAQVLHALWVLCSKHSFIFIIFFSPEGKINNNLGIVMAIVCAPADCHGEIFIKLPLLQNNIYMEIVLD